MFFLRSVLSDDNQEDDLKNNQSVYEIYVGFDPFLFEIREYTDNWQRPEQASYASHSHSGSALVTP